MNREELIKILKDNLSLELITKQAYTGGFGIDGSLYANYDVIQLLFDGEIISQVSLD